MFFQLKNGKTYAVKFSREQTTTLAYWAEVKDDGKLYYTGEVGIASLDSRDRFQKKIGRVVALTNLLNIMSNPDNFDEFSSVLLDREDRKAIWTAYFENHRR